MSTCSGISIQTVPLNTGMDFFLRNGRNGVLFYEMEHLSPLFATFILFSCFLSYLTVKTILNMILLYWNHILYTTPYVKSVTKLFQHAKNYNCIKDTL